MTLVQLDGLLHGAVPKPAEAGELSFFTLYTEWAWAAERGVCKEKGKGAGGCECVYASTI